MITFDKNNTLLINGKRARQHLSNHFIVSYNRIRSEDLSNVPALTKIRLTDLPRGDKFSVIEIEILNSLMVRVFVEWDYWDSPRALDNEVYKEIGEALLTKTGEIVNHRFHDVLGSRTLPLLTTEVAIGTVNEIQQAVSNLMLPIIEPLNDVSQDIEEELRSRFKCCNKILPRK